MQRVGSCHVFAVLHAPREGCREMSLVTILSFVCSFACPKGRMQRVESCHVLVFLSVNAYVNTDNVQRGVQKAHSGDHLF